ncbi:MAG: hypothetical protein JWO06_1396 [Bacteroidota bacterium]|nr:hypothetical protein [Bacteroidota bacterium]
MKLRFILTLFIAAFFLNTHAQWIQLGTGTDPLGTNGSYYIEAMCTDPSGNLYAAGHFKDGNGYEFVSKWNGTTWTELGTGTNALNANDYIWTICSDPAGNIYAGGSFTDSAGLFAYVAKWDGTHWVNLGSGQNTGATYVQSIKSICSDASGNIYAAGEMTDNTAAAYVVTEFNGTTWTQLGTSSLHANSTIEVIKLDGTNLYAAGDFTDGANAGVGSQYVAMWNGTTWARVGTGSAALTANGNILAMCVTPSHDVYSGGSFTNGASNEYVAKWDGNSWTSAGGLNGINYHESVGSIYALCADTAGNVYAGGGFIDDNFKEYVARWNGSSWSELGNLAADNFINSIVIYGSNVYAGGEFENASSFPYVAEYINGASGVANIKTTSFRVYPNPSHNQCNIAFETATTATVTLSDITGKSLQVVQAENASNTTIDLVNYAAGVYIIRMESANQQPQVIKVVKE